uniref:Uncharacterized protein n=1 Tax=Streptomyces sp. F2 TaxID=317660 RepID=V9Z4B3_9ACTN|nr:hypothetical protein pFRL4_129c [Streptomyces sp. F2]
MPPTPTLSRAHTSRLRPLRRSRLVRSLLYALLFMLLACLGDQGHAPESPARLAAASSEAPVPAEGSDGENLDPSESPGRCHGPRLTQAASPQPSPRIPPPAVTALSLTDATATPMRQPPGAVRRLPPSGGRSALAAICRWRI